MSATTRKNSASNGGSSGASANPRSSRPRSQGEWKRDPRKTQSASPVKKSRDKKQSSLVAKIGIPVLTSAIGVAGGVLLSGKGVQRQRKVNIDVGKATARIGEASRRVGDLAGEMRNLREKTQQIAGALS